jgi:hypothetical protein
MLRSKFVVSALVAAVVLLLAPATSEAGFTLRLHQEGSPVSSDVLIADNSAMDLDTGAAGIGRILAVNVMVGDFQVQLNIASSNSTTNTIPARLTINNLSTGLLSTVAVGETRRLVITVEDTGFMVPEPGGVEMKSTFTAAGLTAGSSYSFQSFLDGQGGTILDGSLAANSVVDRVTIGSNPYTLQSVLTVTLQQLGSGAATAQGTGATEVSPTPAPPGLVMFASALPFVALLRLRRRTAAAVTAAA